MLSAPDALQQCRAGSCSSGSTRIHHGAVPGAGTALSLFDPGRVTGQAEPALGLCTGIKESSDVQHLWAGGAGELLRCQAQQPKPCGWAAGSVVTSWSRTSVN